VPVGPTAFFILRHPLARPGYPLSIPGPHGCPRNGGVTFSLDEAHMKRCATCGMRKPLSAFFARPKTARGKWRSECKLCALAYQRRRNEASRRWIREYAAGWRRNNQGLVASAKAFVQHAGKRPFRLRQYYRMRHEAILAYGGYRCACCKVREAMFLTIDHINNDGARHRRRVGVSVRFFQWLKRNGYPKGFQVLCSNCNQGRHRNGGICPHKDRMAKPRRRGRLTPR